jgi:hypothetical protein
MRRQLAELRRPSSPGTIPEVFTSLALSLHLQHLLHNRGLTVYDPRTNNVVFWAAESVVRELIALHKIKPEGTRKIVRRLVWIGPPLSSLVIAEQETGESATSLPSPKKYSHNHEVTSTEERQVAPFDENPQGVWTLVRLPDSLKVQAVFLAVAIQCGARIVKKRRAA